MRIISKLMPASTMKLVMSGVGILALVVFSGFILFEATKAEVVIIDNDKEQTLQTHKSTVKEVLDEAGISVGQHDELSHDLQDVVENDMEIDYKTAKEVIITLNGEEDEYYTTSETIEEFFDENNFNFKDRDDVSHTPADLIEEGLHIEIMEAFMITINNGGKEKNVWTTGGSVEELLADENVDFDSESDDRIEPAMDESVEKGMAINVVRVEKETDKRKETIGFETETRHDSSLLKGKEEVISQGEEGELTKVYEVTYENGEEVERELVDEEITESTNRVVAVGTKDPQPEPEPEQNVVTLSSEKPKSGSSSSPSNNSDSSSSNTSTASSEPSSSKQFTMNSTAYTANCNGCSGITATGINLKSNPNMKVIAVDPSVIPLGSRVWVEGYGEAIAGDTGGSIVGNKIDVHVPDKNTASSWGRKTVTVKILD